jgi:hypothetical protein
MNEPRGKSGTGLGVSPTLLLAITAFLLFRLVSLRLSWPNQVKLGSATVLIDIAANRFSTTRLVVIALMLISLTATRRYRRLRSDCLSTFSRSIKQTSLLDRC